MNRQLMLSIALIASSQLVACGDSGSSNSMASGPRMVGDVAIPNVTAGTNFSFDLGVVVNHSPGFYAFTDRNNKSVDRIDIATQKLTTQIAGTGATAFAGAVGSPVDNSISGPDGVNDVGPGVMYAGDVSSVKVIDTASNTVTSVINGGLLAGSGKRADEGCVGSGAALGTYIISSPEASPAPFATVIDVRTHSVIATINFVDGTGNPAAGIEQCRYDATNDLWFFNNDGSTVAGAPGGPNPHGELDVLTGASVRAIPTGTAVNYSALAGVKIFPMTATPAPGCDPTGLALGPGTDIAIMCREGTTGAPLLVQILNRLTGAVVASINAGGGDQLEYDPTSNRYYGASSRWTASGNAATGGACSAASPCTPVMTVIDAATRTLVSMVPTGNNAHSVAVDPISGLIFMPYSSATSPAGCGNCTANGFINGGVHVLTTH